MRRIAATIIGCVAVAACGGDSDRAALARASSAPGGPKVVWAAGDGADGGAAAKRVAAMIARDDPDRFLYLGDVYANGTSSEFRRNYATSYGRLSRITLPTPGNHEWGNRATGYLPYWKAAQGRAQPFYYSSRIGGWQLISLNSETAHGAASAQLRWLRKRLAAAGTCRLAFWHRPRFSAGTVHGDAPDTSPFWKALRGHARLVVNGHEHNLQRLRRRGGLTEYVSGAGGRVLYGLRRDRRLAFGRTGVTGALRMELQPGAARLEFRSSSGRLLDRSRVSCSP